MASGGPISTPDKNLAAWFLKAAWRTGAVVLWRLELAEANIVASKPLPSEIVEVNSYKYKNTEI